MISHKGQDVANLYMNIPEELRLLNQWVCCKADKNLFQVNGWQASTNKPYTWNSFEHCVAAIGTNDLISIGFVITEDDPYFIIDLDKTQSEARRGPVHQSIHDDFDCYSEISLSGNGCHIVGKGKLHLDDDKGGFNNRDWGVECYSSKHYLIFTGKVYNNKPIVERQELLNKLQQAFRPNSNIVQLNPVATVAVGTDEELIAKICSAANGEQFKELYYNGYPEGSNRHSIDQSFMNFLVFYDISMEQSIRIIKNSKLGQMRLIGPVEKRKKFERKDYLPNTYNEAVRKPLQQMPTIDYSYSFQQSFMNKGKAVAGLPLGIQPYNNNPVPGFLGELSNHFYNASPRQIKVIADATAIAHFAGIVGRQYNISRTGLNRYIIVLAKSGVGKAAIQNGISSLMFKLCTASLDSPYNPSYKDYLFNSPASGQAIHRDLSSSRTRCGLLPIGEFGVKLGIISSNKAASHDKDLFRILLDISQMSGEGSSLASKSYADSKKNVGEVPSPCLSIIGETTFAALFDVLNDSSIEYGLIPRIDFVAYYGETPPINLDMEDYKPSNEFLNMLSGFVSCVDKLGSTGKVIHSKISREAKQSLDEYCRKRQNAFDESSLQQTLWSRAYLKILTLYYLACVSINPVEPPECVECYNWAFHYVVQGIEEISKHLSSGDISGEMSDTKATRDTAHRIIKYLESSYADLASKTSTNEKMHKDHIIPRSYLISFLNNMASYKKLSVAKKKTIPEILDSILNSMASNGQLIKVSELTLSNANIYNFNGRAFKIHPSIRNVLNDDVQ